jgi:hypothetical protein
MVQVADVRVIRRDLRRERRPMDAANHSRLWTSVARVYVRCKAHGRTGACCCKERAANSRHYRGRRDHSCQPSTIPGLAVRMERAAPHRNTDRTADFKGWRILVLLALLRWRTPEARLLLALSIVPATGTWYTILPLFWIPKDRDEVMMLAMTSSVGWLLQDYVMTSTNEVGFNAQVGSLIIAFAYLPCVFMLMRRPNGQEARKDDPLCHRISADRMVHVHAQHHAGVL